MVALAVKDFGGRIPRRDARLLPDNMAEFADNVDLSHGTLDGLPQPKFVVDLSGAPFPVRMAYRMPPRDGNPEVWLPLPSEFSAVCPSPLANDDLHRFYWTTPPGYPQAGAWWNTYDRIMAGNVGANAPYSMGFIPADPSLKLTVSASGGAGSNPLLSRVYLFTYVDQYGQESSPCGPSTPVDGTSVQTWTISGFPPTPAMPAGKNYPPIAHMRLYRTIVGQTSGADFYFVADLPLGTTSYVDTTADNAIVFNNTIQSISWAPPPDGLDGLVAMTGGMLVGFTGNTIHFCEPNRPHAWPAGYDQSLHYQIMALTIWQQLLVVLTKGYPSLGTGSTPDMFTFSQVQAPEPCIARGSIVNDLAGVYYASQNGLVTLNYFGMQNQSLSNLTKNIWIDEFKAEHIIACRHRAAYLAINGTGTGFVIDYTEQRMGIVQLSTFLDVISVWNDVYTGDAYMVANDKIYLWDAPNQPPLTWRWRSKQYYLPIPASLGACQISMSSEVEEMYQPPHCPSPPDHTPPLFKLPLGVCALFRLYAGPEGKHLVHEQWLRKPREIFRLPSGRKTFAWQFEIVSRVPVNSVELASTMKELKKV